MTVIMIDSYLEKNGVAMTYVMKHGNDIKSYSDVYERGFAAADAIMYLIFNSNHCKPINPLETTIIIEKAGFSALVADELVGKFDELGYTFDFKTGVIRKKEDIKEDLTVNGSSINLSFANDSTCVLVNSILGNQVNINTTNTVLKDLADDIYEALNINNSMQSMRNTKLEIIKK